MNHKKVSVFHLLPRRSKKSQITNVITYHLIKLISVEQNVLNIIFLFVTGLEKYRLAIYIREINTKHNEE